MKTHRRFLAIVLLIAGVLAPLNVAVARDEVVIDFTDMLRNTDGSRQRSYDYGYGDWGNAGKKVIQVLGKGLILNLAGSKGGIGANSDLDFGKNTHARFEVVIGGRNQAANITFALVDSDGTDASWDIPLKDQPTGQPVAYLLDMTKPSREDKPGKKPGINLKKLKSWQLRGNFQDLPVELLVIKLVSVPE